jgi:hypothetical protein
MIISDVLYYWSELMVVGPIVGDLGEGVGCKWKGWVI